MIHIDKNELLTQIGLSSLLPSLSSEGSNDCPICKKRLKASVYQDQYIKCWSANCILNSGMNVIQMYAWMNSLELPKDYGICLNGLAEIAGVKVTGSIKENDKEKRSLFLDKILKVYEYYLWADEGKEALNYLRSRGLSDLYIKLNRIGYSPSNFCLRFMDIEPLELKEYSFLERGKEYYSNRIILPIFDIDNYLVHFTGRYLGKIPSSINGEELYPRYKDTKKSKGVESIKQYVVFENKIPLLYKFNSLYITEGYFDACSLDRKGLQTIGILGLEKIGEHFKKIKKDSSQIIFVFDNDKYGANHSTLANQYKSWTRIIPQLLEIAPLYYPLRIYVWTVPELVETNLGLVKCKDINDWVLNSNKSSKDIVSTIERGKRPLIEVAIDLYINDVSKHLSLIRNIEYPHEEEYFLKALEYSGQKIDSSNLISYIKSIH